MTETVHVFTEKNELLLTASAFHIDYCADPEYRKSILKTFVPMQKEAISSFFPRNTLEPERGEESEEEELEL